MQIETQKIDVFTNSSPKAALPIFEILTNFIQFIMNEKNNKKLKNLL